MLIESLESFGLTEGESKVYLALLKLGASSVGPVIKEAKVSNSKIYSILDRLEKKSLISSIFKNKRKYFEASNPDRIISLLEEKEELLQNQKLEAKDIVEELHALNHDMPVLEKDVFQIIFSDKLESFLNNLLNDYTSFIMLGSPSTNFTHFFQVWHEKRVKKGLPAKILLQRERRFSLKRKRSSFTLVRFLAASKRHPAMTVIIEDVVINIIFDKVPFAIIIRNNLAVKSQKQYFELLWKNAV